MLVAAVPKMESFALSTFSFLPCYPLFFADGASHDLP